MTEAFNLVCAVFGNQQLEVSLSLSSLATDASQRQLGCLNKKNTLVFVRRIL